MDFKRSAITELPDGSFECTIRVRSGADLLALARIERFDSGHGGVISVSVHEDQTAPQQPDSPSPQQDERSAENEAPPAQTIGASAGETMQTLSDVVAGNVDQLELAIPIMLGQADFMEHARRVVESAGMLTPFVTTPFQILSLYLVHASGGAANPSEQRAMQLAALRSWIIKNRPQMGWG